LIEVMRIAERIAMHGRDLEHVVAREDLNGLIKLLRKLPETARLGYR
jgi:hypothetical protein